MCDTLVALGPATREGTTLFAKNSDRPPRECQPLVHLPRARHPRGSRVRCQYLELPQVEETAAVLGSRPWWLWGLEQGVNEHRVAIGNETVFAREALGPVGLLGMDLVRLALERARTADQALAVMTELLEAHGQGGSGHFHLDWPYHNGFLIADPSSAWMLETSGRHWAARRVRELGNVSNGLALGADWERGAGDLTRFAVEQGWWPADAGPVDFAAAYADEVGVPPNVCTERRRRAAGLLVEGRGQLTAAHVCDILRDHFESGRINRRRPPDDPHFFSLCMHADPLDNTTAAMVTPLPADPATVRATWLCVGSPCVGAFLPCYLDGTLPEVLTRGEQEPDPGSSWWAMRDVLTLVERDFARFGPRVRVVWDAFEHALAREASAIEPEAEALRRDGSADRAGALLTGFMRRTAEGHLDRARALVRELAAEA